MSIAILPNEILADIVSFVRDIVNDEFYLIDLRLVNYQFNEAVLHTLLRRPRFKSRPESFENGKCDTPLPLSEDWNGPRKSNAVYLRMRLQAQVGAQAASSLLIRGWHHSLRAATTQLTALIAESRLDSTRQILENDHRFHTVSRDPLFTDKISVLVCSATIDLLDLVDPRFHRGRERGAAKQLYRASSAFWIMIAAYYLGDPTFLESLLSDSSFMQSLTESGQGSLTFCLCVAARQGHDHILNDIIMKMHSDGAHYNVATVLREACFAGLTNTIKLIISRYPPHELQSLCNRTLSDLRCRGPQTHLCPSAFATLLNNAGHLSHETVGEMLIKTAKAGDLELLKMLLKRDGGRWIYSALNDEVRFKLWQASAKNVECQLVLAESGFFAMEPSRDAVIKACKTKGTRTAIGQDRMDIAEKLCNFVGEDLSSIDVLTTIIAAAGAKNGVDLLRTNTQQRIGFWQPWVVEKALIQAIRNLHPENVQYLLVKNLKVATTMDSVRVPWRYRRTREERYQAVQLLLQQYSIKPIEMASTRKY